MKNIINKIIIFLCLFLSFPFTVFADYKDDIEKEKQLFEEVTELEKNKNYNAAIEKYDEIIEIYNRNKWPNLLFFPYKKIADNYRLLKDYKKSFEYYQKAIEINKYNISNIMLIFYDMAKNYEDTNDLDNAIKYYDVAADLSNVMQDGIFYRLSMHNKGLCYQKQGRFEESLNTFKTVESIYILAINNEKDMNKIKNYEELLMYARFDISVILKELYRYKELIEYLEKIGLYKDKYNLLQANECYIMAQLYLSANENNKAFEFAKKSLDISKTDYERAISLMVISMVYYKLNKYEESNQSIEQAENICNAIKNIEDKKIVLFELAVCYEKFNDYNKCYNILKQLEKEISNKTSIEYLYLMLNFSYIYSIFGNREETEKIADKLYKQIDFIPDDKTKGSFLERLGYIYVHINEKKALEYYIKAIPIMERINNLVGIINIKLDIATINRGSGNNHQALIAYNDALILSAKINYSEVQSGILFNIGGIYLEEKQYDKATEFIEKAINLLKKNEDITIQYKSLFLLGEIAYERKEYIKSIGYYEKAINLIENLRFNLEEEKLKTYYFSGKELIYEKAIENLLMIQKEMKKDITDLSFKYCESLKARTLLDIIEKKYKNAVKIGQSNESPIILDFSRGNNFIKNTNKEILINTKYLENILDKNTAVLEYYVSLSNIIVWLISKNNNLSVFLIEHKEDIDFKNITLFTIRLEKYKELLNKPLLSTEEKSEIIRLGKYFYTILIKPIEEHLRNIETLVIVPDGPLFFIPFESFIVENNEGNKISQKYLVENYNIKYIQSASLFVKLKEMNNKPTKQKEKTLLAFGDPIFNNNEKQVSSIYNLRGMGINENEIFQQLPFSGEEIKRVGKSLKLNKNYQDVYLKSDATEDHFKNSNLKQYKFIHIATHGIISDEIKGVDQPALVFSLVDIDKKKNDGFLTMAEIRNLNIDADLVVLSACKTAKGKIVSGEGVLGLTRSFMIAGAKKLIVSLWDVNDLSTCEFMEIFYKYVNEDNEIDKALRKTKIDIMKKSIWNNDIQENISLQNPFYWAPFVLYGN